MRLAIMAMVLAGGLGLAVQAAVNSRLREGLQNPVLSALVSFLIGAAALVIVYLTGVLGRVRLEGMSSVPWWAWIGGLFGAFYVTISVVALPRIGAALVIACAVMGQLVAALALDSFGWLGVPKVPFSAWRALGAILLCVGVLLMQKK